MDRYSSLKIIVIFIALGIGMIHAHPVLAVSDEVIRQNIENEVAADFRLRGTMVAVDVLQGFVVLRGNVTVYLEKMRYARIAWTTVGVIEVENEIRVIPSLPVTDDVIKRQVMDALHAHQHFADINAAIVVEAGVVFIQAVFKDPHDVKKLKHKVAEIEGVMEIRIQAEFIS
jgi:osmotically-inducible protein OsmY